MKRSPSWKANNTSASQEIFQILWNLKFHFCFHKPSFHSYPGSDKSSSHHPIFQLKLLYFLVNLFFTNQRGVRPVIINYITFFFLVCPFMISRSLFRFLALRLFILQNFLRGLWILHTISSLNSVFTLIFIFDTA